MTLYKAINWGFSHLGQTFQEVKDIYHNGYALYYHSDLNSIEPKILKGDEFFKLQTFSESMRSRLFIFRDYSFVDDADKAHLPYPDSYDPSIPFRARIIPDDTKHPSSLSSTFIKESLFRIAKGVSSVALSILTLPVWAPVLSGSYIYDSYATSEAAVEGWKTGRNYAFWGKSKIKLPQEPKESHITSEDILKIGKSLIGYRHVSTEKFAQDNKNNGIENGCSLNISFCPSENHEAIFENFDLKISSGKDCRDLIKKYEDAITQFILISIRLDSENNKIPTTYGELFQTLNETRFMIVKTNWNYSADVITYEGLGRFPKENISPHDITLLPRIQREDLKIPKHLDQESFISSFEYNSVKKYLASLYRKELLRYIREDFNAEEFNSFFSNERYRSEIY